MKRYEEIESILSLFNQTNYKVAGSVALYCFGRVGNINKREKLTLVTNDLEAFKKRLTSMYEVYSSDVDRIDITIGSYNVRIIEDAEFYSKQSLVRILPVSSCREVEVITPNGLLQLYVGRVMGTTSTVDDRKMLETLITLNIL